MISSLYLFWNRVLWRLGKVRAFFVCAARFFSIWRKEFSYHEDLVIKGIRSSNSILEFEKGYGLYLRLFLVSFLLSCSKVYELYCSRIREIELEVDEVINSNGSDSGPWWFRARVFIVRQEINKQMKAYLQLYKELENL